MDYKQALPLIMLLSKLGIKSAAYTPTEFIFFGTGVQHIITGLPIGLHHISYKDNSIFVDGVKL